jgi:hypothetical protein
LVLFSKFIDFCLGWDVDCVENVDEVFWSLCVCVCFCVLSVDVVVKKWRKEMGNRVVKFGGFDFIVWWWVIFGRILTARNIFFGLVMSFGEVSGDTNGENGGLGVKLKGWRRSTVPTRALYLSKVRIARAVWGLSDPSTLRSCEVSRKAPFSKKKKKWKKKKNRKRNEREDGKMGAIGT